MCVGSTPDGDSELIKAKWLSLDNHIHNLHKHTSTSFKNCYYGWFRGRDKNKQCFKRREYFCMYNYKRYNNTRSLHSKSKTSNITSLLTNKTLVKAISHLSPIYQTLSLEAFQCCGSFRSKVSCILIPWNKQQVYKQMPDNTVHLVIDFSTLLFSWISL